jgi:ATP-dependent Clp protease ATP-binding subunit ClpB
MTSSPDEVQKQVNDALRATFKPEFLNRIDDVVVFHALGLNDIERIVDIQLRDVRARLARERITLDLTEAAVGLLALDGLDPVYGARPLKRLIQRQVVDNIAGLIIDGRLHEGETVRVDVASDGATLVAEPVVAEVAHETTDDWPIEPDEME